MFRTYLALGTFPMLLEDRGNVPDLMPGEIVLPCSGR